jgi:hypothetical protein
MFTQKSQKSLQNFLCKKCNYFTCKKTDYNKHLLTLKHKNTDIMLTNVEKMRQMSPTKNLYANVVKNINIVKAYMYIKKYAVMKI